MAAYEDVELLHGGLDGLQNMRLELLKVVLHGNDVLTVVVLLNDLLVQAVIDSAAQDVWVVGVIEFVARS